MEKIFLFLFANYIHCRIHALNRYFLKRPSDGYFISLSIDIDIYMNTVWQKKLTILVVQICLCVKKNG